MSSYDASGPDLDAWLKGAAINTDRDLRLQYLAGMGQNLQEDDNIRLELMQLRRFPPHLFTGSAETLAKLRSAIESDETSPASRSPALPSAFIPNRAGITLPEPEPPAPAN